MKTFSLFLCLTLLITPVLSGNTRKCLVVSVDGDTVVLQCRGTASLQTNDRVRLEIPDQE
jgi:hypothetical protein